MPAKITLIAAVARDGVIGVKNKLPWHVPEDFAFFKSYTLGKPVIMGRKTWESLPLKPLPGRTNFVISRQQDYLCPGAVLVSSLSAALAQCQAEGEVCIIGGAQIYKNAIKVATDLRITALDLTVPGGEQFFPPIKSEEWHLAASVAHISAGGISYKLQHYVRYFF